MLTRRIGRGGVAIAALVLGFYSCALRASTFYTDAVDSEFGGPMKLSVLTSTNSGGLFVVTLSATNTSATPLSSIQYVNQFFWDFSGGTNNELALAYDTSAGTWGRTSPLDTIGPLSSVTGGTLIPAFPISNSDLPITHVAPLGGESASVLPTDSMPAVDLGSFSGNEVKNFTMTFTSNNFATDSVGFFVEPVPEPSTMALLAVSGLGLAGYRLRRRFRASHTG